MNIKGRMLQIKKDSHSGFRSIKRFKDHVATSLVYRSPLGGIFEGLLGLDI